MAIRFKNNGDGTTADGAILAANLDEFQEALNYSDPSNNTYIKYIELEADLDLNYSVTWYYRMTDIFNVNGMRTYTDEQTKTVVNGKGHSITNIYVYPNCAVFGAINGMSNATYRATGLGILELNDITFEAILQKGAGFFSHPDRQDWPSKPNYVRYITPITNGCTFNVKVDNSMDSANGPYKLLPFNYHTTTYWENANVYPKAVNCIFNIYIAVASDNNNLFSVNTASASDFAQMTIFESCEFRIRNNTDKLMAIFKDIGNSDYKFLIDNCSFFLADIKQYDDPNQRTTSFNENKMHKLGTWASGAYTPVIGAPKCLFYNSFIAAFGDNFNSGSNDPIYIDGRNDTNSYIFTTSFYDKSKIRFCNTISGGDLPMEVTGFSALTTAECKNKKALSNIGYLFAEEV